LEEKRQLKSRGKSNANVASTSERSERSMRENAILENYLSIEKEKIRLHDEFLELKKSGKVHSRFPWGDVETVVLMLGIRAVEKMSIRGFLKTLKAGRR
jgi:hypothetical protein